VVGQGRDGGVEVLQRVRRPGRSAGSEFRPRTGQCMILGECRPRAVPVRAAPNTLGPQQHHGLAETRDVMKPNPPAAMAHGNDAAVRTTGDVLAGLDAQDQAPSGRRDRADVNALDTEQRVRAGAPPAIGTRHRVIHVGVSLVIGLLGRYQFKEALASFLPHHAAAQAAATTASASDRLTMLICEGP
jgi:hypothetical protein